MSLDLTDPYTFAVVVNTSGDRDLSFPVPGNKRATIKPGERQMMPFDTIASAFGHPNARNLSHKDRSREELYAQLRTYWGFHTGFDVETEDQKTETHVRNGTSSWEKKMPPFRVETVDGEYIPMVLDDPEGLHPLPDDTGVVDPQLAMETRNSDVMQRAMAAMIERQAQQDALIAQLLERLGPASSDVDASTTVPSSFKHEDDDSADTSTGAPAEVSSDLPKVPDSEAPPKADRPRGVRASRPSE